MGQPLPWNHFFFYLPQLSVSFNVQVGGRTLESLCAPTLGGVGGGGVLELILAEYVPLASQSLYPIKVCSFANYRPHFSQFGANVILEIPP